MIAKPRNTNWLSRVIGVATITGLALDGFTFAAPAQEHGEKGEHSEKKEVVEHKKSDVKKAEGEELGSQLTLKQKYDKVRNGVRLILAYDAKSNSFKGTVQNAGREPEEAPFRTPSLPRRCRRSAQCPHGDNSELGAGRE